MTAIVAQNLGKRYGRRWALRECTLSIPAGRVVGLVGANGAGKTTLLHLAVGLLEPTEGTITVLGVRPAARACQLARVGFLAQDAPLYSSLTVADHLRLGERLNHRWDRDLVGARVNGLGLDPRQRAGRLSGGQRAQLALTLAMGKRPDLLVLDEPVSSLDPLARRQFLQDLMGLVADQELTVVLSSHLLPDVERVCDFLVVLAGGQLQLSGDVEELLACHRILTGPRRDPRSVPGDQEIVRVDHTDRQTTMLVRTTQPILDPRLAVSDIGLEDLVLAYMSSPGASARNHDVEAVPA